MKQLFYNWLLLFTSILSTDFVFFTFLCYLFCIVHRIMKQHHTHHFTGNSLHSNSNAIQCDKRERQSFCFANVLSLSLFSFWCVFVSIFWIHLQNYIKLWKHVSARSCVGKEKTESRMKRASNGSTSRNGNDTTERCENICFHTQ